MSLLELQTDLAAAILEGDVRRIARAVVGDGFSPAARVQIYRNHVLTSLTEVLAATYPVVCRLVDRRFFQFAADRYIRRHPPVGPCLFEYGASFAEFLATFPPCAGHPYLADVARLEWAMSAAQHAEAAPPIAPAELGEVPAEHVGRLTFRLDPSASWLQSSWPIDRIWQANQPDADPEVQVDLASDGAMLEVRRRDDVATFRPLGAAEFAFRSALGGGASLETAADTALAEDPRFNLTAALRALLGEALVVGFTAERPKGDSR